MGLGKIVGLGDFDITWSSNYDFAYDNNVTHLGPRGKTEIISRDTVSTDFWNRVMTMGQIKFVLHGSRGLNGGSTDKGNGGNGSPGSITTYIYNIYTGVESFILELGGFAHHTDRGGAGGIAPDPKPGGGEPENPGENGIHGGGGGGCSGESYARLVIYEGGVKVNKTYPYYGGNGGRGGEGCSVYVKNGIDISPIRLATACGGGGGGGAGFNYSGVFADPEGGLAGSAATIVDGVVKPGAGGSDQRHDDKPDGKNATSPDGYTSTSVHPRIEVFAPQW